MTEELSGIFITQHEISNMNMERIVVSDPAIKAILKHTQLTEKAQEEAVYALVDRTGDWEDLEPEEQVAKIKAVLTQETVTEYLRQQGTITDKCTMVQVGIDEEGSIVVEAYYVKLNREQRRMIDRSLSDEQKRKQAEALNILSGNENLVDLAAERIKRMGKTKSKK